MNISLIPCINFCQTCGINFTKIVSHFCFEIVHQAYSFIVKQQCLGVQWINLFYVFNSNSLAQVFLLKCLLLNKQKTTREETCGQYLLLLTFSYL